ncbi:hypothetical protein TREMEDRAFT_70589 [Tremella mesenterica DSM 1558]|uniref:uncharacterized protein n=1 Tax=Tremella mesenterica (strain ATCC 24925 / CBS 8224 / DSM 1558 / NBRC 9311 / NRRL Y-6157 / RJB 2259-6 / UBC 559-6) TaxID=578456 RepID=UPI0003F49088|nr:uncharacterized protein TREMEDRAFT_70589 [Tremella mesenterica DSM 1558]EIW71937.1 hypothetical protein TREMEDRAFT_70589 [Tremella mesenterica DSM 1558]
MRIKKAPKRYTSPPSDVLNLVNAIVQSTDHDLVYLLANFPRWRYPRGDLHTWIPVLDRFDAILAEIIESYKLSHLQHVDFSLEAKTTILEVLRVQRMLVENCTSRKLFCSYDRLHDLLGTTDMDVLHAALYLLLRPCQQYQSQTPVDASFASKIPNRLLALTKGWDQIHAHGLSLVDLADDSNICDIPLESRRVQFRFYPSKPTASSKSHATTRTPPKVRPSVAGSKTGPPDTSMTLDLGSVADQSLPVVASKLERLCRQHSVPDHEHLAALTRSRVLSDLSNSEKRQDLLSIRLLAMATYVYYTPEQAVQSTVFLYEPRLVSQLVDLVRAYTPSTAKVTTSALLLLDACAHHRSRASEVCGYVSGSTSRGALITLLRHITSDLSAGDEPSPDLMDATLTLTALVLSTPTFASMLVGAGILPILLDIVRAKSSRRDNYTPRAVGLIETAIYSTSQGLSMFSNADGINVLVTCIKSEIEILLTCERPEPSDTVAEDTITFYTTQPLRSLLRSIQRLMQASGGTEGLRNLVDSDMPKSLKTIFCQPDRFGPRVYALAANIMATFVNNEPTSLAVLQELQLPHDLYAQLESAPLTTYEALSGVVNAVGAICLNQTGLDMTINTPAVLQTIVESSLRLSDDDSTASDREPVAMMGGCLDELKRHHPTLQPLILQTVVDGFRKALKDGSSFVPDPDSRQQYLLELWPENSNTSSAALQPPLNDASRAIAKALRLLEGILRSGNACQEFVNIDGLDLIFEVAQSPCLPIRYGSSGVAIALTQLCKTMVEREPARLIEASVNSIKSSLHECQPLWSEDTCSDLWQAMDTKSDPLIGDHLRAIRRLIIRITTLNDILGSCSSIIKSDASFVKALGVRSDPSFFLNLGAILRVCSRQHVLFQSSSSKGFPTPNKVGLDCLGFNEPSLGKLSGARFLASRATTAITKMLKTIYKLVGLRHPVDFVHRREAELLCRAIAQIMVDHLQYIGESGRSNFGDDVMSIGIVSMLLLDDRAFEGLAQVALLEFFDKVDGLQELERTMGRVLSHAESEASASDLFGTTTAHTCSGVRLVVLLSASLTSTSALRDLPYTMTMAPNVSPEDLLVKLRYTFFPLAKLLWEAQWLAKSSPSLIRSIAQLYLGIMEGKSESKRPLSEVDNPANIVPPVPPVPTRPPTADPTRVQQLVDMGFVRAAAESALLRSRNNVTVAADLILRMPLALQSEARRPAVEPAANPTAAPDQPGQLAGTVNPNAEDPEVPVAATNEATDSTEDATSETAAEKNHLTSEKMEECRKVLEELRQDGRPKVASRVLELVDVAEELVFDLISAIPEGLPGLTLLLQRALDCITNEILERDKVQSARLRILAVFLSGGYRCRFDEATLTMANQLFSSLQFDALPRPTWIPPMLLVAQAMSLLVTAVSSVRVGEPPETPIVKEPNPFDTARKHIIDLCFNIALDSNATPNELLSALRCLATFSRDSDLGFSSDRIGALLHLLHAKSPVSGVQQLLLLILRHTFEDATTLRSFMTRQVRQWFSMVNKVSDVTHFVRQLRPVALRDPTLFVSAVEQECQLLDPQPPQSVFHLRAKDPSDPLSVAKPEDPFLVTSTAVSSSSIMERLVNELGKSIGSYKDMVKSSTPNNPEVHRSIGTLLSTVTELVGSYMQAKQAFLACPVVIKGHEGAKRRSSVGTIIHQLVCYVSLADDVAADAKSSPSMCLAVSSWASALLVALCSDVIPIANAKDIAEELGPIRKTVLDEIARAIKESTAGNEEVDRRYGSLWALSDLVCRLLSPDSAGNSQRLRQDGSVAKAMLERNFVALLTMATSDMDLNYPDIRLVLTSLLRAVDHLSKLSIKWGKVDMLNAKITDIPVEEDDDSESDSASMDDDSDVDMGEGVEVFRNSALNMYTDEDDDEMDDDEEEEDDEDYDMDDGDVIINEEVGDAGHEVWNVRISHAMAPADDQDEMMEEEMTEDGEARGTEDGIDVDEDGMMEVVEMGPDDDFDEEFYEEMDPVDPLLIGRQRSSLFTHEHAENGEWGWQVAGSDRATRQFFRVANRLSGNDADLGPFGQGIRQNHPLDHPLLADPGGGTRSQQTLPPALSSLQDSLAGLPGISAEEAVFLLQHLVRHVRHGEMDSINIDLAHLPDGMETVHLSINGRPVPVPTRQSRRTTSFESFEAALGPVPKSTAQRWHDELSLFPGAVGDQISDIVNHIVNRLLPPARLKAEANQPPQAPEDPVSERPSDTVQEQTAPIPAPNPETNHHLVDPGVASPTFAGNIEVQTLPSDADIEMTEQGGENSLPADTQPTATDDASAESDAPQDISSTNEAPEHRGEDRTENPVSDSLARVTIDIHGQPVDITDAGIDLDFLLALPDDMRADVVEQHMRERSRASRQVVPNQEEIESQISPEFLNALPPDIRAEVLMQEALEHARRSQPQQQAQDQSRTPSALLAASQSGIGRPAGVMRPRDAVPEGLPKAAQRAKRDALQLLDRAGVASLVRLLFMPEVMKKPYLLRVLVNLCENSTSQTDILNWLLSILHDGTGDLLIVDRNFQQMSIKSSTTTPSSKSSPMSKLPVSPMPGSLRSLPQLPADHIPAFVALRCLDALSHIVGINFQTVDYFLTEQDLPTGSKKPASKKSKGKERQLPQTKYPIVLLMGLLDRSSLLQAPGVLESLTGVLATITKPLTSPKPVDKSTDPQVTLSVLPSPGGPTSTTTPGHASGDLTNPSETPMASQTPPDGAANRPSIIPSSILRLLPNCLTIGECSGRTFGQTLAVMQNCSSLPDGKSVLVQELSRRAQVLGAALLAELRRVCAYLADEGKNVDGVPLDAFSTPSSNQAQLLRLLKTIDFLHVKKSDTDDPSAGKSAEEKAATEVFVGFDFDVMWTQLSRCLKLAESRDAAENVAMILLPLIEALMVVCKYRDTSRTTRSPSVPPPSATSEDLFVSFTTAHRKILNTIVRNNPSLLGGSFSLLIRDTRILEFDNKRNWFFLKLKRKREPGVPTSVLHLNIRRQYVFEDSFHALQRRKGDEIKYGKLNVRFYNEDGIDAGGVTREWYSALARQIFDPNFALFEPCAADDRTYQPNKASSVNHDHLAYFKFVGRVIGKAIYDGRLLDAYFSRAFYKQILGRSVDIRDMESIDPEYHKSLQWMLENDITGVIDQEFTIEDDQFGEKQVVELKDGGASIPVTEENKDEYVRLVVSYRLHNSIKEQLTAFLDGFYDVVPRHLIEIFEPDQLELLISGITTIDVDELKNATQLSGWKTDDADVAWFWRALRSYSQEERARFLMFVTSSSRVPLGGFTQLQGSSGVQPFQLQRLYGKDGSLPQASTCFNLLLLPKYDSYEQLREKLLFAITETGGFGKA